MLYILQTALELGFLYAPVALALFLSYRILDIADLTTDGAFTLGAAVSVVVCAAGHPILAVPLAMLCTAAAGFVTALLQTKLGVPSILAGIITNTGLYTVNLMAMGWTSNASLIKQQTIFHMFRDLGVGGSWYEIILAGVITVAAALLLVAFLGTRLGLSIRATGDNRDMVRASSINPTFTITVGLCVANALTGLSGALVGQAQRSANVNIGTGMVVIGLACLIIGETVLGRGSMLRGALSVFAGSIIYRLIYAVALSSKVFPIEAMKLVTAIIVALAIAAPALKNWAAFEKRKAEARKGGR
ncbi:ABC transporter permease [Flavonifractor sp. An100]|uniref:ABC transporter permease n=1 Tax=Flavonifractor sp. An100 TaxID=1965538 RepID=UPI000B384BC6|nr:ABC transporter permease [Flavonifractor sp. An100]OUQ82386.1 ABC transporter permease [Flavonifractor sp. An100]